MSHSVKTCGIAWVTKLLAVGFGGVSHIVVHRLGLVWSCHPHDRCLSIVKIKTEMDFELVLSLTGLLLVTGWIPGEGLGCKVTRPTVDQDAMHTVHYNHRRSSNDILLCESIRRYAVLQSCNPIALYWWSRMH